MTRWAWLGLAFATSLAPAWATHEPPSRGDLHFDAIPCAVACAYWTDTFNVDIDGDGHNEFYTHACRAPSPGGGFDDVFLRAPVGAKSLNVVVFPEVDWDFFVCRPEDGVIIASGATPVESFPQGDLPGACERLGPETWPPVGCIERVSIRVEPGRSYLLRAYNWSDPFPLRGRFEFTSATW